MNNYKLVDGRIFYLMHTAINNLSSNYIFSYCQCMLSYSDMFGNTIDVITSCQ